MNWCTQQHLAPSVRTLLVGLAALLIVVLASFSVSADTYEPDNSLANTTPIAVNGSSQQHTFDFAGDADFISFDARQGRAYYVEVQNTTLAAITDTVIDLYWPNGTLLAQNDDDLSHPSTFSSRLLFEAPQNGAFSVRVREFNSNAGGSYTINVTEMGVLNATVLLPLTNDNVTNSTTFTYTSVVQCSGGPCGAVLAILDPEENGKQRVEALQAAMGEQARRKVDPALLKELKRNSTAKVLVLVRDTPGTPQPRVRRLPFQRTGPAAAAERVLTRLNTSGFARGSTFTSVPGFSGEVNADGLLALAEHDDVLFIGYDQPVRIALSSSVPAIQADAVWQQQVNNLSVNGSGVTICVLDTGINYTHTDFGACSVTADINDRSCPSIIGGMNYCPTDACNTSNSNPLDNHGHGSHVSGTIMSRHGTFRGVAPGASIVAMKVLNSAGTGSMSNVIAAIDWCTTNAAALNISVISMSLGSELHVDSCDRKLEAAAIDAARSAGILVVSAAGNAFNDEGTLEMLGMGSPACVTNATSVGATDDGLTYAAFSNRDIALDLLAPGVGITATWYTGGHASTSGTSMATPHVSGVAALLIHQHRLLYSRNLTPTAIEELLKGSGTYATDPLTNLSRARVNALAASQQKGVVPTTPGALPFWTPDENPVACGVLADGENCTTTWEVNATASNGTYTFFAIYESEYSRVETRKLNMTIIPLVIEESELLPSASLSANQSTVLVNNSFLLTLSAGNTSANATDPLELLLSFNSSDIRFENATATLVNITNATNSSPAIARWSMNGTTATINTTFTALSFGELRATLQLVNSSAHALASANSTITGALPDTQKPNTTAFTATSVTATSAVLSLTVDENASCRYGTTDANYSALSSLFTGENTTEHTASLTSLASSTEFTYFSRCTDSSGNVQNTSVNITFTTDAEPVRSGGGGGGGGGGAAFSSPSPDSPEQSFRLGIVRAGDERVLRVERAEVPITEVQFVAGAPLTAGTISVEKLDGVPAGVQRVQRRVHSYLSIDHPAQLVTTEARVAFSLPLAWLADVEASATDVQLLRHVENEWIALPTRVVQETDDSVAFEAVSPGFSYFAITLADTTAEIAAERAAQAPASPPIHAAVDEVVLTPAAQIPAERPVVEAPGVFGSATGRPIGASAWRREMVILPLLLVSALFIATAVFRWRKDRE